jgi:hypothetical protein
VRRLRRTYNQHWLIERHGYRTPTEAREHLLSQPRFRMKVVAAVKEEVADGREGHPRCLRVGLVAQ